MKISFKKVQNREKRGERKGEEEEKRGKNGIEVRESTNGD